MNLRTSVTARIVVMGIILLGLLIPLWLQRDLGYTSIWAGLATAPGDRGMCLSQGERPVEGVYGPFPAGAAL